MMKQTLPALWRVALGGALLIGYAAWSGGQVQAQQPAGRLAPGDYSRLEALPSSVETVHWSAEDLERARQQMIAGDRPTAFESFVTRTHSYIFLRRGPRPPGQPLSFEHHGGVTDVYIIVDGSGEVIVDGEMQDMRTARPGERLGHMTGGRRIQVGQGDIVNIPPNTTHGTVPGAEGLTYVLQKINVGLYPWSLIGGTSLIDADPSSIEVAPPSVETMHWSADDLARARQQMMAGNRPTAFETFLTRTHSYIFLHRSPPEAGRAPAAELHEGVTDVYIIVGGSGELIVGGEMQDVRESTPGEHVGTLASGGRRIPVKKGDIVNIPPNTSHATIPGPEGLTYVLQKINIGMYPWFLINGTP